MWYRDELEAIMLRKVGEHTVNAIAALLTPNSYTRGPRSALRKLDFTVNYDKIDYTAIEGTLLTIARNARRCLIAVTVDGLRYGSSAWPEVDEVA